MGDYADSQNQTSWDNLGAEGQRFWTDFCALCSRLEESGGWINLNALLGQAGEDGGIPESAGLHSFPHGWPKGKIDKMVNKYFDQYMDCAIHGQVEIDEPRYRELLKTMFVGTITSLADDLCVDAQESKKQGKYSDIMKCLADIEKNAYNGLIDVKQIDKIRNHIGMMKIMIDVFSINEYFFDSVLAQAKTKELYKICKQTREYIKSKVGSARNKTFFEAMIGETIKYRHQVRCAKGLPRVIALQLTKDIYEMVLDKKASFVQIDVPTNFTPKEDVCVRHDGVRFVFKHPSLPLPKEYNSVLKMKARKPK